MCPTMAAAPAADIADRRPSTAEASSTAATPLRMSSAITTTPSGTPVVRSTFAAPTLPLPATRTSMPARRARMKANGTEPNA
jgi:hypothetical protein